MKDPDWVVKTVTLCGQKCDYTAIRLVANPPMVDNLWAAGRKFCQEDPVEGIEDLTLGQIVHVIVLKFFKEHPQYGSGK